MNYADLKPHPMAEQFPLMGDDELEKLADDIKEYGLHQPIVILDEKILDGRNRYGALKIIGHQFSGSEFIQFEDLDGAGAPEAYVISANIKRRQLTPKQRAAWAEEYYEQYLKKKAGNPELVKGHGGMEPKDWSESQHDQKDVGINVPRIGEHRDEQEVSTSRVAKTRERREEAAGLHGATVSAMEDYAHLKKTDPQAASDQKAGKPPKQKAPRKFSAKEQKAIAKIERICGENIAKALLDGTLDRISGRTLVRWAQEDDEVIKGVFGFLIDKRDWSFNKALQYVKKKVARDRLPEEIKRQREDLREQVIGTCPMLLEIFDQCESIEAQCDLVARVKGFLSELAGKVRDF